MSSAPRLVDLTQVPAVPWAWVDEHVYAAIRGCSVKVLQNERRLNLGCPFRRINGTEDSGEAEHSFRKEAERHSGIIPNTIGAQRRWQLDCARTVRLRQEKLVRSEARESAQAEKGVQGKGAAALSPPQH